MFVCWGLRINPQPRRCFEGLCFSKKIQVAISIEKIDKDDVVQEQKRWKGMFLWYVSKARDWASSGRPPVT